VKKSIGVQAGSAPPTPPAARALAPAVPAVWVRSPLQPEQEPTRRAPQQTAPPRGNTEQAGGAEQGLTIEGTSSQSCNASPEGRRRHPQRGTLGGGISRGGHGVEGASRAQRHDTTILLSAASGRRPPLPPAGGG
jgi:hypothetical protein